MSAADFVDNTEFFMHNLLQQKNHKTGPFFVEFWQYLNVCVFPIDGSLLLLHSGYIQVLGPNKLEQDSFGVSQGQL